MTAHDLCVCYRNLAARVPPPVTHDGVCCLRDGTRHDVNVSEWCHAAEWEQLLDALPAPRAS